MISNQGNGYQVINPACASPHSVVADVCGSTKGYRCIALKPPSGQAIRMICYTVGLVGRSSVLSTTTFMHTKEIKQVILFPLRGEWERAVSFFGHVFGHSSLAIGTFGAEGANGITIKTLALEPSGNGNALFSVFIPFLYSNCHRRNRYPWFGCHSQQGIIQPPPRSSLTPPDA